MSCYSTRKYMYLNSVHYRTDTCSCYPHVFMVGTCINNNIGRSGTRSMFCDFLSMLVIVFWDE